MSKHMLNDRKETKKEKTKMETDKESEGENMEKYGYIECSNAVEAVEIKAKLDHEGVENDICYDYNGNAGLWVKVRIKE